MCSRQRDPALDAISTGSMMGLQPPAEKDGVHDGLKRAAQLEEGHMLFFVAFLQN